MSKHLIFQGHI